MFAVRFPRLLVWALLLMSATSARAGETLSYADLVERMTDLERLAVLPQSGESCAQFSSWDRRSRYDEKTGKYVAWGANGDSSGCVRKEGSRVVLAEMEGPGCIWRVWSAAPREGHMKIYVDGRETPVVDLPFQKYFSGDTAPFDYPALSYNLGHSMQIGDAKCYNGQNLYLPIPYRKSCKIVAEEGWGAYYHFTYSTFSKGTQLASFNNPLKPQDAAALQKLNDFFTHKLGTDPAGIRPGQETASKKVTAGAGQTVRAAELAGPRAISALKVKMKFADRQDQMAALRALVLQVTFDGQSKPAVWCPLGDFFGTAPGENLYKSLLTGMTGDGYYAYWYMPFGRSAVVEIVNEGKESRNLEMEVVHAPLGRPFDGLGYFHAKWHRDVFLLPKDRQPDWTMLRAQGRGRFCGVMLHVWNPKGAWWGEGDEKFFVDGEKMPSTFGTGSEDYFGYAWGHGGFFQRPYHCQNMTQNNAGHQALLRWHVADNVPFQKSFEGCMEKYDPLGPYPQYACTACWYLSPDGIDPHDSVPADQRDGYYADGPLTIAGIDIVGPVIDGTLAAQNMASNKTGKWRDDDQLRWCSWYVDRKLSFRVPVERAGAHRLAAVLAKGPKYGTVQFYLDGKKLGGPVNLRNEPETILFTHSLGTQELSAGDHVLTAEMVGPDKNIASPHLFGLDYVECEPVR